MGEKKKQTKIFLKLKSIYFFVKSAFTGIYFHVPESKYRFRYLQKKPQKTWLNSASCGQKP